MKSLSDLYREMQFIRLFEEKLAQVYQQQEMRCPMHLSIGQEAVAVGVSAALRHDDWVYSNHRAHAHYLAKGGNPQALIAELYGFSEGCSGGRGGSMHLIDLAAGFGGSTPIVGGTVPIAVGAAWALKLQGKSGVVVSNLGDGCFEEGVVHESWNFALLHKLPVVFVLENNNYSVYTQLSQRQPARPIAGVAAAHGLFSRSGDGNRVLDVQVLAQQAVDYARAGFGPAFLELATHRIPEHCGPFNDDHLGYRQCSELDTWLARCPLLLAKQQLLAQGIQTDWFEQQTLAQNDQLETIFAQAKQGKPAKASAAGDYVYA
jgi:TPP-dependent pyruvate/acetoin dehydrogenase alpha subunit